MAAASEMDVRGCGHGLREEEIDAVAMAVTVVLVNTMSNMSSSSCDIVMQLPKRRALLQSVAEAPDCVATCEAVVQPYGGINQGPDEERFDTWQKVVRGCVERAFERLKCMWHLFLSTHKTNLETLPRQFRAVCTLHNILLDAGIDFDENLFWEVDANGVRRRVDLGIVGNGAGRWRRSTNVDGDLLRDALRDRLALM
ncbi:hypothetical protein CBR_g2715 [Chara braunii]|uniref:DDE Tnp4 domain-containing protein n=1 Tax=Chara braunii TaxID=69332 RepID=A0A388KDN0_CHABU|nr:hypothetical protein CBR_g2715 [Chara braunii]|eukprot:GBG68164.1 hypothetical protein CBR_g2715 [Chara braunii]